jgi:micrococcal nuclease
MRVPGQQLSLARGVSTLGLIVVGAVVLLLQPKTPQSDLRAPTESPSATSAPTASTTPGEVTPDAPGDIPDDVSPATVASITDGDTLRVDTGDSNESVRLLALDAPEVSGDCGASQATAALAELAPVGSRIWMQADVEGHDRYGRLLRYLWREDGAMINRELVRRGWAPAKLYPPNDRYWPLLQQVELHARTRKSGLWDLCGWTGWTAAASPPQPSPAPNTASCDPRYSGCIPVYPPDVDCRQVDGPVVVLGEDPHNLDGDHDRLACEPLP